MLVVAVLLATLLLPLLLMMTALRPLASLVFRRITRACTPPTSAARLDIVGVNLVWFTDPCTAMTVDTTSFSPLAVRLATRVITPLSERKKPARDRIGVFFIA